MGLRLSPAMMGTANTQQAKRELLKKINQIDQTINDMEKDQKDNSIQNELNHNTALAGLWAIVMVGTDTARKTVSKNPVADKAFAFLDRGIEKINDTLEAEGEKKITTREDIIGGVAREFPTTFEMLNTVQEARDCLHYIGIKNDKVDDIFDTVKMVAEDAALGLSISLLHQNLTAGISFQKRQQQKYIFRLKELRKKIKKELENMDSPKEKNNGDKSLSLRMS